MKPQSVIKVHVDIILCRGYGDLGKHGRNAVVWSACVWITCQNYEVHACEKRVDLHIFCLGCWSAMKICLCVPVYMCWETRQFIACFALIHGLSIGRIHLESILTTQSFLPFVFVFTHPQRPLPHAAGLVLLEVRYIFSRVLPDRRLRNSLQCRVMFAEVLPLCLVLTSFEMDKCIRC